MYKSDMTCCRCRKPRIPVQTHHIDDDPSNNVETNIAVLCTICHDDTMLRGGFGRKFNAPLVRKYKSEWETRVRASRETGSESMRLTMNEEGEMLIRASWVRAFGAGTGRRQVSVDFTNRFRETRYIDQLGLRVDSPDGGTRYFQLHYILSLAHIKAEMKPGIRQSFNVSVDSMINGPALLNGLKSGESLSVFINDTMGRSWHSNQLEYVGE